MKVCDRDIRIELDDVMSNFDRQIEKDIEKELKETLSYAGYAAWDFHGDVWYEDGKFYCEIWRYHCHVNTLEADTLEEIMEEASEKYGYQ